VTIAAPLIAELPKPTPAIILLSASLVAFVAAFFLPSRAEEERVENEKLKLN